MTLAGGGKGPTSGMHGGRSTMSALLRPTTERDLNDRYYRGGDPIPLVCWTRPLLDRTRKPWGRAVAAEPHSAGSRCGQ